MSNEYREIDNKNYFERLKDSFKGIFFGIILLIGSTYALYWNEIRVNLYEIAKKSKEFTEGDIVGEKQLISYTGVVKTIEPIGDNQFLKPQNDIVALSRSIEMYAWVEDKETKTTEHASGSSTTETTYRYRKEWTTSPEDSSNFKYPTGHTNPQPTIPTGINLYKATTIYIDTYLLEPYQLSVSPFKILPLSKDKLQRNEKIEANYIFIPYLGERENINHFSNSFDREDRGDEMASTSNSYKTSNSSLTNPQIGDIRISYKYFPANIETTIFGLMKGERIIPYKIKNEDILSKMSGGIYRLFIGDRIKALADLKSEEKMKLWIIRIVSLLLMFAGFNLIFGPINAIFNILNISSLTRYVTGFISFILTAIIATFAILFGKLSSLFGFIGAVIAIIVALFVTTKFIFNRGE